MAIDFKWLEDQVLLRKTDAEEQALLSSVISEHTYEAGDVIMQEGQPGGLLCLLRAGLADISCLSEGKSVQLTSAGEGYLFGEMTFLTGDTVSATVTATEPCVVYQIDRMGYSELMLSNQELVYALFAYMLVQSANVIRRMNQEHVSLLERVAGI